VSLEMRDEDGQTEAQQVDVPTNGVTAVSFDYAERLKLEFAWTDQESAGIHNWTLVASSSDGSRLAGPSPIPWTKS